MNPAAGSLAYRLDPGDPEGLAAYLRRQQFLLPAESVTAAGRAGEGNMNLTLRVRTGARSLIVKQGRPWVEKYPHIPAPAERTQVEGGFYRVVQKEPRVAGQMPRSLGLDPDASVLVLQDFPDARDFTGLYAGEKLPASALNELVDYLGHLHELMVPEAERALLRNPAMRALNHEHIFRFPLDSQNGLNLDSITSGLKALSQELCADVEYVAKVRRLGELYLGATDGVLCHGDFFPGSWLATASGTRIIDPEFCFLGPREFDLGVMLAHLHLTAQPKALMDSCLQRYEQHAALDRPLVFALAGVEIMRRLIGVAQLPLRAELGAKRQLLQLSRQLVLGT